MTGKLDALPWLDRLNKVIDGEIASGNAGFAFGPILAAVIRGLHEKGIFSTAERDGLLAAWNRLDEHHRVAGEKQMKALREQYPELAGSILNATSDPP
jgi:hypothetical protein